MTFIIHLVHKAKANIKLGSEGLLISHILIIRGLGGWLGGQWMVGDISFQKMYGLYGTVEISGDVTDVGRTDGQR